MDKHKVQPDVDTRTLDGLMEELRSLDGRLGVGLRKLQESERLSEAYHDALAEIYALLTVVQGLASDLKTEIDLLDDQSPDE
ncbi:MAG TPA: hypothetical protein VM182_05790 [Terriglobia bacterium]|nr:hypothetical protein [Terriglobia bacterium]